MQARPAILVSILAWSVLCCFAAGGVAAEISSSPELDLEPVRGGRVIVAQTDLPHATAGRPAPHDPPSLLPAIERRCRCTDAEPTLEHRPLICRHFGPRAPPHSS